MGLRKWPERRPDEDFERILAPDGSLLSDAPQVSDEDLLHWHHVMVKTRLLEDMTVRLQRRGVFSVAAGGPGEEAAGLGAAAALRAGDWIHPSYRQNSALLFWNLPIDRMLGGALGHAPEHVRAHVPLDDAAAPQVRITPYAVFLGANIPLAAGTALSDKLNQTENVTLAFIGEGSTSEGDFHDGLGLAGVLAVPLVVVIVNNQWSISIPASRQTAADTFAQKAVAHGIPHRRVDGNDVFAVYEATRCAVDHARKGGGPTVIEAVTYRMTDHNTADAAVRYRDDGELEYWAGLDPLARFETYLTGRGLIDADFKTRQQASIDQELRASLDIALRIPPTPAETMFLNHLHGDGGWSHEHQMRELAAELAGQNPFLDFDGRGLTKEQGNG